MKTAILIDERLEELINESQLANDSRRNNELVKLLRTKDSAEIYSVVRRLVELDCPNQFEIARRALNDKKYVEEHFKTGLGIADKSNIQTWVGIALPKLGAKTTFKILLEKEAERPGIVDDALYFLPRLIHAGDRELLSQLRNRQPID